ncbi:MAG: MoaD/ThiS family protein [Acidobacteria bacterium]|nr:MoaD/ThiS family protein [Acidobacteriota bacterium]
MPKVFIPTPLRSYAGGQDSVDCAGATVAEVLADLTARHKGLEKHLFDEAGAMRSFVNVYRNDEDVRYLEKEKTPVGASDTLSIVPSIAGGSHRDPLAVLTDRGGS